jgi:hypothetical protein
MIRRALLLLTAAAGLQAGTAIRSYDLRLVAMPDGSARGTARLELAQAEPGPLAVPVGASVLQDLRLEEAPAGTTLQAGPAQGQALLHAQLPKDVPAAATLAFSFRLPHAFLPTDPQPGQKPTLASGNRLFRHAFVQTQAAAVGSYRCAFLFPEGMMAQSVREALPKPRKTEVAPRVRLERIEGRQAAVLRMDNLQQGDDAAMTLELTPERKSPGWLLAGTALSLVYLIGFRDLVARKRS